MTESDAVLRAAVEMFRRDGWIDARALAAAAGIGRSTLYRRYGDRNRIIGEAIWAIATAGFEDIRRECGGRGADGIAEMIRRSLRFAAAHPAMRTFVAQHTDTALRVLTSRDGVIQRRFVATFAQLIRDDIGEFDDIDTHSLAYAVIRIGESFYFRELITGEPDDIDAAAAVIRRMLR
ncbi:QsdR family transcriptional regulator [Nocardia brasiliensis]